MICRILYVVYKCSEPPLVVINFVVLYKYKTLSNQRQVEDLPILASSRVGVKPIEHQQKSPYLFFMCILHRL
jgi:hypothetical protein